MQANITLCTPPNTPSKNNNKTFIIHSSLHKQSSTNGENEKKQKGKENDNNQFEDMKRMIWMKKSWKQVPVGNDKPESPGEKKNEEQLPICPSYIPSSLFMR